MPARILTPPVVKMLAVAAVALAGVAYLYYAGGLPKPDEQNRVTSPAGYSIIKPPDYEARIAHPSGDKKYKDSIEVRIPTPKTVREPRIFVGRFRTQPDLSLVRGRDEEIGNEFQGQPAYVFTGQTKREFYWRAIIPRGEDWYEVVLWQPLRVDVTKTEWWPYVQSFRTP
jgi:hypothetical protein